VSSEKFNSPVVSSDGGGGFPLRRFYYPGEVLWVVMTVILAVIDSENVNKYHFMNFKYKEEPFPNGY